MSATDLLFSGWTPIIRTLLVGIVIYATIVLLLRFTGSRSLAKMNAFDFIITIAIGSTFGSTFISSIALSEAMTAVILLLMLQYFVGRLQINWLWFNNLITNPATLLYFEGEFLRKKMDEQRVTEEGLRAAVRQEGFGSMDNIDAVILESSGDFSVIDSIEDGSALGEMIEER